MKAQFLPLFNVNLSQLQLNSTLTQFPLPLNLISTSFQPQVQINLSLKSTSTITSTQYGCDIKATQSCIVKKMWVILNSITWFYVKLKSSINGLISVFAISYHQVKTAYICRCSICKPWFCNWLEIGCIRLDLPVSQWVKLM